MASSQGRCGGTGVGHGDTGPPRAEPPVEPRRPIGAGWTVLIVAVVAVVALASQLLVRGPTPARAQAANVRIVVLPDSQKYVTSPDLVPIALGQFAWSIEQAAATNTVFVAHVGDVVSNARSETEWDRIAPGFTALETADLAYGISPGNKDLVDQHTEVPYDRRFGTSRFQGREWFGASFEPEGNRANYSTVESAGHQWLFVQLRHLNPFYGNPAPMLEWLDQVLADHPDHLSVVTTHEFTLANGSIVYPDLRDVIQGHCNVIMVHSGHRADGAGAGTFDDRCGRTVHHVLTNYQHFPYGGNGFLRTVDIDPITFNADFRVYSPHLDGERDGPAERFSAQLAPLPGIAGDALCDRFVTNADTRAIIDHVVGNRSGRDHCPLANVDAQVSLANSDLTGDRRAGVGDAMAIAQCAAGVDNGFCSALRLGN